MLKKSGVDHGEALGISYEVLTNGSVKVFDKSAQNSYYQTHTKNWENHLILVECPQMLKKWSGW